MTSLVVVGGSHGAGKSTYCRSLVAERGWTYLTNQEVRRAHGADLDRAEVHRRLRRWVDDLLRARAPFVFEHIMSGRFAGRLIELGREHGYSVELVYLDIGSAGLAHQRVDARVSEGGHDVERDQVEARLLESRANFWSVYRARADAWTLLDSSGLPPVEIARRSGSILTVADAGRLAAFQARLDVAPAPRSA